jgi:condensin complex subunit 3
VNHARCAAAVRQLMARHNATLVPEFFSCLDRVLLVFKREPAVERLVAFIARTAAAAATPGAADPDLASFVLEHLLSRAAAKDKAVRFRVCQLISAVLRAATEDSDVSVELQDAVIAAMVDRLSDRVPAVRVQACGALQRLQFPEEEDVGSATAELQRVMASDSVKVHVNVLNLTLVCLHNLGSSAAIGHCCAESRSLQICDAQYLTGTQYR